MPAPIEHVVVLCMENRSFDHMLGYLDHPDPSYDGLRQAGPYSNRRSDGAEFATRDAATSVLPCGPDHSHDAVMQQLAIEGAPARPTHSGFLTSYELVAAGQSPSRKQGLVGIVMNALTRLQALSPARALARGPLVMECQGPQRIPALRELALAFAVCDHWFCSVPGETWPNRNFLHAATSRGETNIAIDLYYDRTIFQQLDEAGLDWRIYHDGVAQALVFPYLWDSAERLARWFPFQDPSRPGEDFAGHVSRGDLPAYTFIEPNHMPPGGRLDRLVSQGRSTGRSNSQHPENSLVTDQGLDGFPAGVEDDFARGDQLIATVYESLRANPELFERTLLLITYDEHGGFYDHRPAPRMVAAPDDHQPGRTLTERVVRLFIRETAAPFYFTRVGVRVPAVVVSPLVDPQVDHTFLEHASVPATVRAIFAPDAQPLTRRDAGAATFHGLASRSARREDLPDLSAFTGPAARPGPTAEDYRGWRTPAYYKDFVKQAGKARRQLRRLGEQGIRGWRPTRARHRAKRFDEDFVAAARRHRGKFSTPA